MESPAAPRTVVRTILIVDDQKSVLATLEFVFSQRGHRVLLAPSGAAALAMFADHMIDSALVDLHMPEMGGTQVCRRLCDLAAETHRPLAVWLMTAAYTTEAAKLAVESGARGLIKKPFDWLALCREIEEGPRGTIVPFPAPSSSQQVG